MGMKESSRLTLMQGMIASGGHGGGRPVQAFTLVLVKCGKEAQEERRRRSIPTSSKKSVVRPGATVIGVLLLDGGPIEAAE